MSAYPTSIGEPESSQDTPLRNTTPLKRRSNPKARPGLAKKVKNPKLNQCQALFQQMCMSRSMEDEFDQNFDTIDKDLNDMDRDLDNDETCIGEAKKDNDDLLLLIQELEDKSRASKQYNDHLGAEVIEFGTTFAGQQAKPADIDMPDYDEHHDDLVIRKCTKAHSDRAEALQTALENTERVKQQIKSVKGELWQVQADFSAQLEQVRVEYDARLSQQRRELEEKAQKRKEKFNEKLKEKEQVINELTAKSSRSNQREIDDAWQAGEATVDRKMEELQLCLRETKQELRDARQAEKISKHKLDSQELSHDRDLRAHRHAYEKLQADQRCYEEEVLELQKKLETTEAHKSIYGSSVIEYMAKTHGLRERVRVLKSSLDGTVGVALTQMMQLDVARRDKGLLVGCLANAKSHLAELGSQFSDLTAKASVRESRIQHLESDLRRNDRHLDTRRELMKDYTLQIKELQDTKTRLESRSHNKDLVIPRQSKRVTNITTERDRLLRDLDEERKLSVVLQGQSYLAIQHVQELTTANNELIMLVREKDRDLKSAAARLLKCQKKLGMRPVRRADLAGCPYHGDILGSALTKCPYIAVVALWGSFPRRFLQGGDTQSRE